MAVYKNYAITLDTIRTPRLALQNIVAGETGNKLTITLTNGGSTVSLNGSTHRVCLRVDSSKGTRRQDSSLENSGISFNNGKAVILLSRDAFAAGQNRACLEIFSTETETNDTLITSAEFVFTAKKNDSGENAGAVYPSLIIAEQEAAAATAAANEATEAANEAAEAANAAADELNELLDHIDNTPTENSDNLVTSGGVYAAIPKAATNTPNMDGTASVGSSAKYAKEDHVHPHDTSKQDVLTFDNSPTANSNNPVKSSGVHAALSEKSAFLGCLATIESAPPVSSYRIGDFFLYVGGDGTLPIYGTSGVSVKQFDVFVCKSCEGFTTNHTPIATPTWTDFCVLTGLAHTPVASNILPLKNSNLAKVGTSGLYARADHVHPSDTSKLNVSSAPMIFRLEPNWTGLTADETDVIGATINDIVDAHTSSVQRPIMACVVDPYGGYTWVVETGFSISSNVLVITLYSVSTEVSYVEAQFQIDLTTKEFTEVGFWFVEV